MTNGRPSSTPSDPVCLNTQPLRRRLKIRENSAFSMLLANLLLLVGASGCGTEASLDAAPADSPRLQPARVSTAQAPQDRGSTLQVSALSDRSLVLSLKEVPKRLLDTPLADSRWKGWLQQTLGAGVEVKQVRSLDRRSSPASGGRVVIEVARTTPERIRQALDAARASGSVAEAEADPVWSLPSGPAVAAEAATFDQWYLDRVGARAAWNTTLGSPEVVVAVIDSGVDYDHQDLRNAIWINQAELDGRPGVDDDNNGYVDDVRGWNFVEDDAEPRDETGHGTHVAGIIAAVASGPTGVTGVAPGVRIMALRAGALESQLASNAAEAIRYAADNGARIINMSNGGSETFSGLRDAIDYATSKGVLLVAAAHNYSNSTYVYPAIEQEFIAVAALESTDVRSDFSNYGHWVDVAAPGSGILSTVPNNGYGVKEGTSQAAPIVAGVAALVASAHPQWKAKQIRKQVLATADEIGQQNPDYLGLLGAGRVNAAKAVGPVVTSTRAYVSSISASESVGNGDQELGRGEQATITVSLQVTSAGSPVSVALESRSPHLSITDNSVSLELREGSAVTARFDARVSPNAPLDHEAELAVVLLDAKGTRTELAPTLRLPVQSSWRREQPLPFACSSNLLRYQDRQVLVSDLRSNIDLPDWPFGNSMGHVYASFRNTDGSFTNPVVLSDTSTSAQCPSAVVAPNGDIHVVYHHRAALTGSHGGYSEFLFPMYTRYDVATGQWSTPENADAKNDGFATDTSRLHHRVVSVGLDAGGGAHVSWPNWSYDYDCGPGETGLAVSDRSPVGAWTEQFISCIPYNDYIETELVTAGGVLRLFVRGPSSLTAPIPMAEYNQATGTWSGVAPTSGVTVDARAMLPFAIGDQFYRVYSPVSEGYLALARLENTTWTLAQLLSPDAGAGEIDGLTGLSLDGTTAFGSLLSRRVPGSQGSERLLVVTRGGIPVSSVVPGDRKYRATSPALSVDGSGSFHALFGESVGRTPLFTSYITQAAVAPAALPTLPVVQDDGATTRQNRSLHASWSSTHSAGIASYRFAWGTAPGADDIAPWQETTATEATVDLGDRRLLPGQTAYLSVQARSNALLSSAVASSDGIHVVEPELGDVNGDGDILITDALLIAQRTSGQEPTPFFPQVADVNCDGSITVLDSLLIAQYSVGTITRFPCQE